MDVLASIRARLLACLLILAAGISLPGAAAPLSPGAYSSLGNLDIASGSLTFNTDTLTVSGGFAGTGVVQDQSGFYPDIAVFTFGTVNIGAGVTVTAQGARPLAILSQGNLTIAPSLDFNGSKGGDGGSFFAFCDNTSRGAGGTPGVGGGRGGAGGTMDASCPLGNENFHATSGSGGSSGGLSGGGPGGSVGGDGGSGAFSNIGPRSLGLGLSGGSGGGGGGGIDGFPDAFGAGGGGGGGAVEFGANGIVTLNSVSARGGAGGNAAATGGAGGAGSGGGIFAHGSAISIAQLDASSGGSVRVAPGIFSIGDTLPTVAAGLAELAPDLTRVPTGQTLTLAPGGTPMPGGLKLLTKDVEISGGELKGNGTVGGNLLNAGTLSPGSSPGHIDVMGDFIQDAAGSLHIELGGTSRTAPVEYDSIDAVAVLLDGQLDVHLVALLSGDPLFAPALGDFFDIILGTSIGGDFSSFLFPTLSSGLAFDHDIVGIAGGMFAYRLSIVEADGARAPLPATILLLGLGLACLGWSRRRKYRVVTSQGRARLEPGTVRRMHL
jgi:hypothetical protein